MKKMKVSLIVPIYNAEQYLEELIKCINNQKYKNYEVILINDGSNDNSENICKNICEKDNRFKYFYKDNSGVSNARNLGIDKSTGDYICFVDADDKISENYLYDFVQTINSQKCDLVCCDMLKFNGDNLNVINNDLDKGSTHLIFFENSDKFNLLFSKYAGYVANRMFNKKIIEQNKIRFIPDISMSEDALFSFQYLNFIDKVVCLDKKNYYYRVNQLSASKSLFNIKWFSILKVYDYMLSKRDTYSVGVSRNINYAYLFYLLEAKYRLKFIKKSEKYNEIKEDIEIRLKNIRRYSLLITNSQKIKFLIYKYLNNLAFSFKIKKENKL